MAPDTSRALIRVPLDCVVIYGKKEISYSVVRCSRKTLEIAVMPSGLVQVRAPQNSSVAAIAGKVRKRVTWILRQQAYFKQFCPHTPERQYLGGETHRYLGKKYRLKVLSSDTASVKMANGFINVTCATVPSSNIVKKQLDGWYREKAYGVFNEMYSKVLLQWNFKGAPPIVQIRSMKTRWGSLSKSGILTLNSSLIHVPKECIEYVIVHELCHVTYHNHDAGFYQLLKQRMPDWEIRKQKLESALV